MLTIVFAIFGVIFLVMPMSQLKEKGMVKKDISPVTGKILGVALLLVAAMNIFL